MTRKRNPYDFKYIMLRDSCNEFEAKETVKKLKNKTSGSLENYIKRYGEINGTKKYNEFCAKSANTKEKYKQKYGVDWEKEWKKYIKTKDSMSEKFHKEKYGATWEKELQKRKDSITTTIPKLQKKHGKDKGLEIFNQINSRRGRACSFIGLSEKYGKERAIEICKSKAVTVEKIGPVAFKNKIDRERRTKEKNGTVIPLNQKSALDLYRREVSKITNSQDLNSLENFEKRGHQNKPGRYAIDHKISVMYGFKNSISPEIIGGIDNLQMLTHAENSAKGKECYSKIKVYK